MQTPREEFEAILKVTDEALSKMTETIDWIADEMEELAIRQRRIETRLVQTMLHFRIDPYERMKGHSHNPDQPEQDTTSQTTL